MKPDDILRIEVNSEAWKEIIHAIVIGRDISIFRHNATHVKIKVGEGMWTPLFAIKA